MGALIPCFIAVPKPGRSPSDRYGCAGFGPEKGSSITLSSRMTGSTPKKGSVAEPGRQGQAPGRGVIMAAPVSVCHHVSTIGHRPSPTVCKPSCLRP